VTVAAGLDGALPSTTPVAKLIDRRFLTSLFIVPFLTISLRRLRRLAFLAVGRPAKSRARMQVKYFTIFARKETRILKPSPKNAKRP
jgi:hypothetical protein